MPHTSTLHQKSLTSSATERAKRYDFFGRSKLTLFAPSDSEALKSLATHFEIPQITLESFRRIGGKRFMCGKQRIFPPANANA